MLDMDVTVDVLCHPYHSGLVHVLRTTLVHVLRTRLTLVLRTTLVHERAAKLKVVIIKRISSSQSVLDACECVSMHVALGA